MRPWFCRKKLLSLYCAVRISVILTTILLFQARTKCSSGPKPNVTHFNLIQTYTNTSYNAKLNLIERMRLGFAIEPESQIKPKPWQDILFEKNSLVQKPSIDSPSLFNYLFNSNSKPPRGEPSVETKKQKRKQILIYNKPEWGDFTSCPEDKNKNPEFNCDFIDMQIGQNISRDIDAIFVYALYANINNLKLQFEAKSKSTVQKAPKYIYFTLEAPFFPNNFVMQPTSKYRDESRGYLASHWRGSDIYAPYFRYESLKQNLPCQSDTNYALGRSKMAAIVVSNCSPNNNRTGLVKELQKFVQVDVFGDCGTIECRQKDCFTEIKKNYKFYLAFENSNCRDYITEKLRFNAYGNDLLPIVFGAHPSDYKAIAPPNSYIHIEDFESLQQLGEYLHLLDKNDILYNSYFAWKDQGYFSTSENLMCEICAFIQTEESNKDILHEYEPDEIEYRLTADAKNTTFVPYFNGHDKYDFVSFNWTSNDARLCLPFNEWYWNK